jgi:fructose-1,6-bisphosphatase/inositol monophosphatase family enzyme
MMSMRMGGLGRSGGGPRYVGGLLRRSDKSAGDFATTADLAAEKTILEMLRTARPDDADTGEESARTEADGPRRRWLVDPLCGTLNYSARGIEAPLFEASTSTG